MTDAANLSIYYVAIEYQINTVNGESHFLKHCMQADFNLKE